MKLLLSGGGDPENVVVLDQLFVDMINTQETVLYIPVAWENDPTYAGCLNWFKGTYHPYGITNIEMCTNLNHITDLSRFTAIFIGGGNTFKLLKEIKESRFDEKLIDYLNDDGFVYGSSAGAFIFGKTIKSAEYGDDNNVCLTDLSGFNMLGGSDIFCHYSIRDNEFITNYSNDLYILYDESGLYVNNNRIESIGKPYLNKNDVIR